MEILTMPTEIHELPVRLADCLKLCYLLRERGEPMTAQAVRTLLEAKEPGGHLSGSVLTHAFERLQACGYVSYTRYHGVVFTESGEAAAAELIRHHRLLELFLVRILNVPLDQVNAEAEQLEHVLSELVEERIDILLGHPTEDPHGDPIPDTMGQVQTTPSIKLTQVAVGQFATIQRITTENVDLVRYLETLQLVPGTVVRLEARTTFGDVLTLRIGETHASVSMGVADHLLARVL
jgi:DtxR family transcriptional regulator, Mn-dependent transcriptional regulator